MANNKIEDTKKLMLSSKTETIEITISPDDRHQYYGYHDKRLSHWLTEIDKLLRTSMVDIEYKLYTDISIPTVNIHAGGSFPRLHMHGIIKFTDNYQKAKFLLNSVYNLSRWANVTYNPLRADMAEWLTYCKKSYDILSTMVSKKSRLTFRWNGKSKKYIK